MNIRIYPAKWRRLLSILLTIAAVVGILVFGESFVSSAAQSMEEPESKEKDVSITNEGFVPEVLAAKIGATITWTNNSSETVFLIGGLDQKVYLPMVFREQLSSTLQNKGQGIHNPLLVAGNSEQASWNSPPIAPAESFSRTYNVVGQFTIFLGNDSSKQGLIEISGPPDLVLTKDDGDVTAVPGNDITYTLTFSNAGSSKASGVIITETVPLHTSFVTSTSSAGWQQVGSTGVYSYEVGNLSVDARDTVTFVVKLDDPLPAVIEVITNTAEITDDGSQGQDLNPSNNETSRVTPIVTIYDMATYLTGDGRLYEVQHSGGSQARHQTQFEDFRFFHTKGIPWAEWEELWSIAPFIYRGTDTSPGNDQYYTLRENGQYGSPWSPHYWHVGGLFKRNPWVAFYQKSDCSEVADGWQTSWLKFADFYPTYNFEDSEIILTNVVELQWLLNPDAEPIESYFYAEDYGLVGWGSNDRGFSYISEIHPPGTLPDNMRETISCLDTSGQTSLFAWPTLIGPLPPPYRAK